MPIAATSWHRAAHRASHQQLPAAVLPALASQRAVPGRAPLAALPSRFPAGSRSRFKGHIPGLCSFPPGPIAKPARTFQTGRAPPGCRAAGSAGSPARRGRALTARSAGARPVPRRAAAAPPGGCPAGRRAAAPWPAARPGAPAAPRLPPAASRRSASPPPAACGSTPGPVPVPVPLPLAAPLPPPRRLASPRLAPRPPADVPPQLLGQRLPQPLSLRRPRAGAPRRGAAAAARHEPRCRCAAVPQAGRWHRAVPRLRAPRSSRRRNQSRGRRAASGGSPRPMGGQWEAAGPAWPRPPRGTGTGPGRGGRGRGLAARPRRRERERGCSAPGQPGWKLR